MNWNTVDTCIQDKSLLNHEFYIAWSKGMLTLDDLRFYAKQYYALETTFPRLLSRVHSSCEDAQIRQFILENLNDEELGEENHRELWLRFAEGLGLTREEVINAPLHPMTKKCIDELMALAADTDPAVGLSALYAYESQLPAISQSKIDGLKNFYGIEDPRAIQFFEVHKTADVWHAEQEKTAITHLKASMDTVYSAVEKSCDALRTFMDGVDQATRLTRPCAEMVC
jgi:pyrroloquinoline-quinone synthase